MSKAHRGTGIRTEFNHVENVHVVEKKTSKFFMRKK